ncbi:IMPACT family protein [Vulcaniibacterium tengchongense]|uniref:Putative YigZ family protein n=1 Tax=Vulcaniibacterium tengchongense TaxID=1273429 RepID=A0A3N4V2B0_9GAMM|nr:YigZ family protein [Vulcaniibacterium tengchongense]RPE77076.1 putative YigZ family protein [Vulcaniibacterium tengchongense]
MSATLAGPASHLLEVKHSRFLAQAAPAADAAAALAFVAQVADPAATHNCWAYRIGQEYRFNDDGEPAGTAGRPILAAIDGQGLDQVVVVVTRWFGGVKLGAGGLVRAYGGSAAECLRTAPRRELVRVAEVGLDFPFEDTGAVHAALAAHGAEKLDERYRADGVGLRLRLPESELPSLKRRLRDATRDRVRFSEA